MNIAMLLAQLAIAASPPSQATPPSLRFRYPVITADDYPERAMLSGETGIVSVSLTVAANGLVKGCRVTETSESTVLDDATCAVIKRRMILNPARDAAGVAVEGVYATAVSWGVDQSGQSVNSVVQLPVARLPKGYFRPAETHLVIDYSGHVTQCDILRSTGNQSADKVACAELSKSFTIAPPRSRSTGYAQAVRFVSVVFVTK